MVQTVLNIFKIFKKNLSSIIKVLDFYDSAVNFLSVVPNPNLSNLKFLVQVLNIVKLRLVCEFWVYISLR